MANVAESDSSLHKSCQLSSISFLSIFLHFVQVKLIDMSISVREQLWPSVSSVIELKSLFKEYAHFWPWYVLVTIGVKLFKNHTELLIWKHLSRSSKDEYNKSPCFNVIKLAAMVFVKLVPQVFYALADYAIEVGHFKCAMNLIKDD